MLSGERSRSQASPWMIFLMVPGTGRQPSHGRRAVRLTGIESLGGSTDQKGVAFKKMRPLRRTKK